ncbi:MAG: glycolate oxidase subunit GlcF [Halieaceae bacterium]|jgi:glycolate oxidase iron-sulfur subunit|nr:glycolate oxidase subunit GlcF [Halieaceae bacterium]
MHVKLHPDYTGDEQAEEAAALISACVHCGFCLETCPTYLVNRDERDSPRGRIYLIRNLLESGAASDQTHTHLDRCLSCRSCETTCPSGMQYGQLLDIGRGLMEQRVPRPAPVRLYRRLLRWALTQGAVFGFGLALGQLLRPLLPSALRAQVPPRQDPGPLPEQRHSRTMLLLEGCVQAAATPRTNAAARRVFDRLGISLQTAPGAGCCGAVNYHLAAHRDGLDDMRRNIDAWWPQLAAGAEAILSSASGCGSMLAEYGRLLAHDPAYADRARQVSALARDIGEVLLEEDLETLATGSASGRIAVQTPCSLQHGMQRPDLITSILGRAGFELAAVSASHLCCGSAGTYSILQGAMSRRLRDDKLRALTADSPDLIATGNVGCQLHLQAAARVPVRHWIELLDPDNGD